MSIRKINTPIDLMIIERIKDREGFSEDSYNVIASVKAYKEDKNSSKRWANRALFTQASTLFRFRRIPKIKITNEMVILCLEEHYEILSVEDIRNRNMYIEVLARKMVVIDG